MRKFNSTQARLLARSATEAMHYAVIKKALLTLLATLVVLSTLTYIVAVLYSKYGSFTVGVNKYDGVNYSLTLSEDETFDSPVVRLNAKAANDITNISSNDIPADIDSINGEHNGKNYLAYTFYLKNIGEDTVTYEYSLGITNVTNNVDKAVRIRVYRDGNPVTYADLVPTAEVLSRVQPSS